MDYPVGFCYLFGSYAKGKAIEESDIDLLVSTDLKGLKYYGFVEKLKNSLHKNMDVLDMKQFQSNPELTKEILKINLFQNDFSDDIGDVLFGADEEFTDIHAAV